MSKGFEYVITKGQPTKLLLRGEITEVSEFAAIQEKIDGGVRIDTSGISRVNSCGVREWITFMESLAKKGHAVELENCSPAIVRQLSMIVNAKGSAQVRSILVPYYCETCDDNREVPCQIRGRRVVDFAEIAICPKCKNEMEFDDMKQAYFAFLSNSPTSN
jgi:ABC-type transporter Mla MlaB component